MENKKEINELIFNLQNPKKQLPNDISSKYLNQTLKDNNIKKQTMHDSTFKIPTSTTTSQPKPLFRSPQKNIKPMNSYAERYKHLLSTVDSKQSYRSNYNHLFSNIFIEKKTQSVYQPSTSTFYLGKKTMRSTEDMTLEKISIEKKEARNTFKINRQYYNSHKKYTPIPVSPSPLTLIKPFNLSASSCSEYLKKRMINTPNEINEINKKIIEKVTKKCEDYENQIKNNNHSDVILCNKEITLTPDIVKVKKIIPEIDINLSLSARINQYCAIASEILKNQTMNENQNQIED